ncbi:cystathionine gamma-synthase [Algimonas ampicilliniresistens]|uniref:Cystathionine gamma-synthase n=1 Tax=Algimonas ampicilliniresistens TaxID=1298735 RepID=A0ABQ5VAM6_9PROT|nr:cystathionine gamma-synthase [Algimonas ampicilliniresistens]GLQ24581.1 cystathionine gamma-synthase [Algimonas ampicilliniresistens]
MTSPTTKLVQSGIAWDPAYGAIVPPLYMSSTYVWPSVDEKGPYDYGRSNNPNRDLLSRALTELDGGAGAVVTSSGMAAIDLVLNLLSAGAHVVAPHDCYGGTHRLLTARHDQGQIRVDFIDQGDLDAVRATVSRETAMVIIETPSNPLMRLSDVAAICDIARAADALSVVDNTFLSPLRQQPLTLGADMALQSTTKYLNGHSDVVGGVVVANTEELAEKLAWWANAAGLTGSPFDSYQTLRGLRTLALRINAAETNAKAIVAVLRDHDKVTDVYYPDAGLAVKQQSGPGAMLSFRVAGGAAAAASVMESIELFRLAASLGGVESLICQPATMTHRGMAPEARAAAGLDETLIRVSTGIEAKEDLIAALEAALASI